VKPESKGNFNVDLNSCLASCYEAVEVAEKLKMGDKAHQDACKLKENIRTQEEWNWGLESVPMRNASIIG
jgi:hypothetical protein